MAAGATAGAVVGAAAVRRLVRWLVAAGAVAGVVAGLAGGGTVVVVMRWLVRCGAALAPSRCGGSCHFGITQIEDHQILPKDESNNFLIPSLAMKSIAIHNDISLYPSER